MPGYDFRADWNNDGSFESPGEDLTGRTLARSPIQVEYGRDQARSLAPARAGALSNADVNNLSRDYSPENAASPLATLLKPGRPLWWSYNTRANLVPNPSFEVNTTGWSSSSATLTRTTAQLQVGAASLNAVITTVASTPTVNCQRVPVIAGRTYTVSAYGRSQTGTRTTGVKAIFYRGDGSIALNPTVAGTSSATGVWTRRSSTVVAPADAESAGAIVFYTGASVSDVHQIDAVMLEESAALNTYFDGDTSGAFWRTNAHGSASIIGYVLYRGYIDNFAMNPEKPLPSVTFTGLDALARLREANVSTELFQGIRTGEAVNEVLDAVGWPADKRDIDTGATSIAWWWEEGADAFSALERIVNSEGPGALITIGTEGELIFRDRHHRLIRTASTTVQATFSDSGTEPLFSKPFGYDAGFREVVNSCSFTVTERGIGGFQVVWESEDFITVAAGVPLVITAVADDPFIDAVSPSATSDDFEVMSGSVSATLSRTTGQSTRITLTSAAGATLTALHLRARPVTVSRTVRVDVEDAASIAEHGPRRYDQEAPWMGRYDALAVGQLILNQRAQRRPTVSIRVVAKPTQQQSRFTPTMARNLSDRVHLNEAESGINADFFVEQIAHEVNWNAQTHAVTLGCEKVVTNPLDSPSTVFILNSGTNGVLNTNKLGY